MKELRIYALANLLVLVRLRVVVCAGTALQVRFGAAFLSLRGAPVAWQHSLAQRQHPATDFEW